MDELGQVGRLLLVVVGSRHTHCTGRIANAGISAELLGERLLQRLEICHRAMLQQPIGMEFFLGGFDDEVRRHLQLKEHARRNVAVVAVDEYGIDASNVLVAAAVTVQAVHSHRNVQPLYICFHESFGICLTQ